MPGDMVRKKRTTELLRSLRSNAHFEDYLRKNSGSFIQEDFRQEIVAIFERQNRTKAEIARAASISEPYLHQIFSGRRVPSRNKLICLCIGLQATEEETQKLLRLCGYAGLYARDVRDAVILHGITHWKTLGEINEALFENRFDPLIE